MIDFTKVLFISLLLFSMYSALEVLSDQEFNDLIISNVKNTTAVDIARTGGMFALFSQSLNNVVPTIRYDVSYIDGYVVGINDIPIFDSTDLFIVIPLSIIPVLLLKSYWGRADLWHKIGIIILITLIISGFWLLTKFLYYQLYLYSAGEIGLSEVQAIAIREGFIENTEESKGPLFLVTIFMASAILISLNNKKKK